MVYCGTLGRNVSKKKKILDIIMPGRYFSFDDFRDISFKNEKEAGWDEAWAKDACIRAVKAEIAKSPEEVGFFTSLSPLRALLFARKTFGIFTAIKVVDLQTNKTKAINEVDRMNDGEILQATPYYFQHHHAPEWQDIPAGADRARAVLLSELTRYESWRFK